MALPSYAQAPSVSVRLKVCYDEDLIFEGCSVRQPSTLAHGILQTLLYNVWPKLSVVVDAGPWLRAQAPRSFP